MEYDLFKDKFIKYYIDCGYPAKSKDELKRVLNKELVYELQKRDSEESVIIRDFINLEPLNISVIHKYISCKTINNNILTCTTYPNWRTGWRKISQDDVVYDLISGFFHFASQYIHRSYQVNLLVAIALVYNKAGDFRGNKMTIYNEKNSEFTKFTEDVVVPKSSKNKSVHFYLNMINSLDPLVNKVNFYYIKSVESLSHEFLEEAITNLDNLVDTIVHYFKLEEIVPTTTRRCSIECIANFLNLSKSDVTTLKKLYQLRCQFTSHPAQTKWWDFSEIYDEDIDIFFNCIKNLLVTFYRYEKSHRKTEEYPKTNWSTWFSNNAVKVYDAVWFHKLPNAID